uniref:Cyclin N-terminal domain-containing protein n=1 Tax=Oryza punctata TaxID=4537 RepID=A0A0E0K207_ORYPU
MDYLDDADADVEAMLREIAAVAAAANGSGGAEAAVYADDTDGSYCAGEGCACAAWTYDADLYASLRCMEMGAGERPSPVYMATVQRGQINPRTRASLVAWMEGITREHGGLAAGTLHRAVSYVDRYLSARPLEAVSNRLLALLGVTAVFVAAKYESDFPAQRLSARDAAHAGGFSRSEVLDREVDLLDALGYRLGCPTAHTFADHFLARYGYYRDDADASTSSPVPALAHHLADLTLLDCRSLRIPPSVVAASAVHLARYAAVAMNDAGTPPPPWDDGLEAVTGYSVLYLARCMGEMYDVHETGSSWPGYAEMKDRFAIDYQLLPRRLVVPLM